MTSISASQFLSPRAMMDARISAATEAGSISTEDQTALESALDSIDKSLSSGTQSSKLDPSDMKTRIDGLIDAQVSAGTLTDDQAAELKEFFAQGPEGVDGTQSAEGAGGMRPMGPPPPGGCGGASDSDSDEDDDTTTSTTDQLDSLIAFLEKLRESISSSTSYGSNNSADNSSGLLVDQFA